MGQRPSWKANSFSTVQSIFLTLWNQGIHHHVLNPLSLARPIQSKSSHPISWRPFWYHYRLYIQDFQVASFLLVCPPKLFMHVPSPHRCHKPRPSNTPWYNHLNNIWWKVCHEAPHYVVFPASIYFLPLMLKCPPQRLFLEYSQPILFPCFERPYFIPIQNHIKIVVLYILTHSLP